MGGVTILLMITAVVLCIVIAFIRRYHVRKSSSVNDQAPHDITKDVNIELNGTTNLNRANNSTIKLSSHAPMPTNAPCNHYDVPITLYNKTSEYENIYAKPNEHSEVKMEANPSYGVSKVENRAISSSATVTNSDTRAHQSSSSATTKHYDYAYVNTTKLIRKCEYGH